MNNFEYKKLRGLLKMNQSVQPKTYLDDLAETGWLDVYLDNYSKERIEKDDDYKERVYDSIYNYSKEINEDVEAYFLEKLIESLSFFNEYTSVCNTIQRQ